MTTLRAGADGAALEGAVVPPAGQPVPDALAPPPHHLRFPHLDGMRAIAALTVLGVHAAVFTGAANPSTGGRLVAHLNVGVTIFFLISGFLLYRPFIAHRTGGARPPTTGDYFKRRALRIYPAYWVVLTALVVIPGLGVVQRGGLAPMYALLHTVPFGHGRRCVDAPLDCGLAQTWSLVVELTFYAVLPLYAAAVGRATRRLSTRAWVAVELGVLAAASVASVALEYGALYPAPWWMTGTVLGSVLWFAVGMGMAVLSVAGHGAARRGAAAGPLLRRPGALWLAALIVYVALSRWLPASPFLFARGDQVAVHLAFAAIAALLLTPAVFGTGAGGLPRRVVAHPLMAWLGLVSYGIFLWHYQVILKLGAPGAGLPFGLVLLTAVPLSVALAAASYYLVERPCLRLKYRSLGALGRRLGRA